MGTRKIFTFPRSALERIYSEYPKLCAKHESLKGIDRALVRICKERNISGLDAYNYLLERVRLFRQIRTTNIEWCKNAVTWFNQKCYEDDEKTWRDFTHKTPQKANYESYKR